MVGCIVKRSIPLKIARSDFVSLRKLVDISPDELPPSLCVIVPKPFRVLALEAQHMSPDYSVVISNFIRDLIQFNLVICL